MDKNSTVENKEEKNNMTNIHIIPTSHISKQSEELVNIKINEIKPDIVAVELDSKRIKRIRKFVESEDIENMDLTKVSFSDIISKEEVSLRGRIFLYMFSKIQNDMANQIGVDMVGIDMISAYKSASDLQLPVALIDQDINTTINRFTNEISFISFLKNMSLFIYSYYKFKNMESEQLEKEIQAENISIEDVLEALDMAMPTFKQVFIDERNEYMVNQITNVASIEEHEDIVVVIGAGHYPGIERLLQEESEDYNIINYISDDMNLL